MPARNSKGRFVKGGHKTSRGRSGGTTAIVVAAPRAVARRRSSPKPAKRHTKRRRSGGGGGGVTMGKLIGAGIGLSLLTSESGVMKDNSLGKTVRETLDKVPGTKTLGRVAVAGLGLGAIGKWVVKGGRVRPWLLAAGAVGIVAAAIKVGEQNSDFKWLGDDDDMMDVQPPY